MSLSFQIINEDHYDSQDASFMHPVDQPHAWELFAPIEISSGHERVSCCKTTLEYITTSIDFM